MSVSESEEVASPRLDLGCYVCLCMHQTVHLLLVATASWPFSHDCTSTGEARILVSAMLLAVHQTVLGRGYCGWAGVAVAAQGIVVVGQGVLCLHKAQKIRLPVGCSWDLTAHGCNICVVLCAHDFLYCVRLKPVALLCSSQIPSWGLTSSSM